MLITGPCTRKEPVSYAWGTREVRARYAWATREVRVRYARVTRELRVRCAWGTDPTIWNAKYESWKHKSGIGNRKYEIWKFRLIDTMLGKPWTQSLTTGPGNTYKLSDNRLLEPKWIFMTTEIRQPKPDIWYLKLGCNMLLIQCVSLSDEFVTSHRSIASLRVKKNSS